MLVLVVTLFLILASVGRGEIVTSGSEYGVDVSWPTHHLAADKALLSKQYKKFMQGCYEKYGKSICDSNEADRIAMNLAQPSYQRNFTSAGFAKVRAPTKSFQILKDFYFGFDSDSLRTEAWSRGSVYTNHWETPTLVLNVDDPDDGMNLVDRRLVVEEVQAVLERWGGVALAPTSLYGIRAYQEGSILTPHVDRLPLVISAIINVAQEITEDWPLEVIGHDGIAVNVTMAPGDMVLYEGHSVIHGRPFPLNGIYFANIFFHFEPVGYTMELERRIGNRNKVPLKEKFNEALARHGEIKDKNAGSKVPNLPPYIDESSEEATKWRQMYIFFKEDTKKKAATTTTTSTTTTGSSGKKNAVTSKKPESAPRVHSIAAAGKLKVLEEMAADNPAILHQTDANGWLPIHEAARSGHTQVIEYLIKEGADVNARTNDGRGASPLWWAEHMLPNTHPAIKLLRKHGAKSLAPGSAQDKK